MQVLAAGLEEMEVMLQGALLQRTGLGSGRWKKTSVVAPCWTLMVST